MVRKEGGEGKRARDAIDKEGGERREEGEG